MGRLIERLNRLSLGDVALRLRIWPRLKPPRKKRLPATTVRATTGPMFNCPACGTAVDFLEKVDLLADLDEAASERQDAAVARLHEAALVVNTHSLVEIYGKCRSPKCPAPIAKFTVMVVGIADEVPFAEPKTTNRKGGSHGTRSERR